MSDYCFSFLEDDFKGIALECEECEIDLVEQKFKDSLSHGGLACELIIQKIAEFNGLSYLNEKEFTQFQRLECLTNQRLIDDKLVGYFHDIRKNRNYAVHPNPKRTDFDNMGRETHRKLYAICVWFYENYGYSDNSVSKEYLGTIYVPEKMTKEKVIEIIREEQQRAQKDDGSPKEQDKLQDYPFKIKNNSYLLNELSKLSIHSCEAVESDNDFSMFKNYIHVDRPIQEEFIDELKRVVNNDSSHLVMLCGSVGDGKSHLLSYVKSNEPELYNKFTVHSDATESHYTNKNAIDTLAEVLSAFNDDNIGVSFEKFILAINLGVLNNFLESDYAKENYTKLKSIIDDADIFNSKIVSKNIIQDKVSLITFSDYNLFELTGDSDSNYVSSNYIHSLIKKITNKNDDNPFYRAYSKDKELGLISPIIYNYEMLSDGDFQKIIIEYIIRVFVEYKKIISTRDLLNFIYELIVPHEIINYDESSNIGDFVEYLLPNMLFNNAGRSDLLFKLSNYDPTLVRNEKLDEFIMEFNINSKLSSIINKYFTPSKLEFLDGFLSKYEDLNECSGSEKRILIITLIRFAIFYGKSNFKNTFINKDYLQFLNYLYAYNSQSPSQYHKLFLEIQEAIFNLKGSIGKHYICIDELENFKISKSLNLKYDPDNFETIGDVNRFKTSIKVFFRALPCTENVSLDVDFPLYSTIVKLNKGYQPNKAEKENIILFEEFIYKLINQNISNDLVITTLNSDDEFFFEYSDVFDSFSFGRS